MASCSSTLSTAISHRWNRLGSDPPSTTTKLMIFSPSFFHHSLLASNLNSWPARCRATSPGSPPQSEPPSNKIPQSSKGIMYSGNSHYALLLHPSDFNHAWLSDDVSGIGASFSRFKDTVQIFVAVLFWMSLFFWSSAWDGRNNDRPNKGSRFRK